MNTKRFAELAGIAPNTLRRWTSIYEEFLSPSATPPKGKTRSLSDHDVRVLHFVATLRDTGQEQDAITERLKELQANSWANLPAMPAEWSDTGDTMSIELAQARAGELAQLAVLQSELQHTRKALENAQEQAKKLENQLEELQRHLDAAEDKNWATEAEKMAVQLQLAQAKGEVARLESELRAFGMAYGFGHDKPISIALIIGVALLAGAVLVIVAMLVTALIL